MEEFTKLLLKYTHEYQIINNIKSQCFTNTLLFVDVCNNKKKDYCKYEVGCVMYIDNDNNLRSIVHCWCSIDGKIIDPSYDVASIQYKKVYYNSVKEIFSNVEGLNIETKKWMIKQISYFNKNFIKCFKNRGYCVKGYNELHYFITKRFQQRNRLLLKDFNSKIDNKIKNK